MKELNIENYNDQEFDAFQDNFMHQLRSNYGSWGVTPGSMAHIIALQAGWESSWHRLSLTWSVEEEQVKDEFRGFYYAEILIFLEENIWSNPKIGEMEYQSLCSISKMIA